MSKQNFHTKNNLNIILAILIAIIYNESVKAEFDPWPAIKQDLFESREIKTDQQNISLFVADKVEDAAVVPVNIRIAANAVKNAEKLYLIIDRNPDPYAMQIEFQEAYKKNQIGERLISTRIRLNEFSRVRAVLETNDGSLFMAEKFAAGAGGCSTPPNTDINQALNVIGQIRVKSRRNIDINEDWNEAIIMVRHPNFTGMQPDVKNENEMIPANYVEKVEVFKDEEPLLIIHSGISISENPVFRFSFGQKDEHAMAVKVLDSEENIFTKEVLVSHAK